MSKRTPQSRSRNTTHVEKPESLDYAIHNPLSNPSNVADSSMFTDMLVDSVFRLSLATSKDVDWLDNENEESLLPANHLEMQQQNAAQKNALVHSFAGISVIGFPLTRYTISVFVTARKVLQRFACILRPPRVDTPKPRAQSCVSTEITMPDFNQEEEEEVDSCTVDSVPKKTVPATPRHLPSLRRRRRTTIPKATPKSNLFQGNESTKLMHWLSQESVSESLEAFEHGRNVR